ncbi:molybdopterin molybdotransferase MoeA [Roseomonas elaeocarpi]|uniref:Molybdopterin molybdenumtransferase n=1 Tax=Roseomonas elaeocarpi TaxID=907779 RepID=A0ABV6JXD5_9PROT
MIPVEEALMRVLGALSPVSAETVALPEAWGRVLARPVAARLSQPPADVSAMDGYAVRAADATEGARLALIGAAPAGHPFEGEVGFGQAVRIFTGGFVPRGADGILLQEDAERSGDSVLVRETVRAGRWIRAAGLDFREGESLLQPGRALSARDVGLAAAANHPWLTVHRRPTVGILATGDEIVLPGEPLPRGSIVSSNAHALAALVRAGGGQPVVLPVARDSAEALADTVGAAARCDILVTSGGASVGEHDLVRSALAPHGFAQDFWRIAMRPGKPLIWGRLGEVPLLGLPGNPVSALVCGILFLLPALRRLSGLERCETPLTRAATATALPANDGRQDYLRARVEQVEGELPRVEVFARQDSSMLQLLAAASALVIRAPHAEALPAGAEVRMIELGNLGI